MIEHPVPMLFTLEDLDLDPEIAYRKFLVEQPWHADGILFRGQDAGDTAAGAALDETIELTLGIAVVVGIALGQLHGDPETAEALLEALW